MGSFFDLENRLNTCPYLYTNGQFRLTWKTYQAYRHVLAGLCLTLECFALNTPWLISGLSEKESKYSAMTLESPVVLDKVDTSKTDLISSLKETLQLKHIEKMSEEPEGLVFSTNRGKKEIKLLVNYLFIRSHDKYNWIWCKFHYI